MSESDFDRIAKEVSPEAAEKLMRAFGGASLYVPRVPGPEHKLSIALGHLLATRIADTLGPGRISVPTGARAEIDKKGAQIDALLRCGRPQREIVRKVGCSERTVARRARQLRETMGQSHRA